MAKIKAIGMAEARPLLTPLVEEVNKGGEPYLIISGSRVKAILVGIDQYTCISSYKTASKKGGVVCEH